jgi:hypothetical protein
MTFQNAITIDQKFDDTDLKKQTTKLINPKAAVFR